MKLSLKQTIMIEMPIFGGLYFALSNGSIKTYNWKNTGREAILRAAMDKKGYLRVGLQIGGRLRSMRVHRLIADAFIPNPKNKPQVNHINGIKSDNRVENLEWVTPKENTMHAIGHGLFSFQTPEKSVNKTPKAGELNGLHLLTDEKVIEIRRRVKGRARYGRRALAKEFDVTENCIKDVVIGKSWKHLL